MIDRKNINNRVKNITTEYGKIVNNNDDCHLCSIRDGNNSNMYCIKEFYYRLGRKDVAKEIHKIYTTHNLNDDEVLERIAYFLNKELSD